MEEGEERSRLALINYSPRRIHILRDLKEVQQFSVGGRTYLAVLGDTFFSIMNHQLYDAITYEEYKDGDHVSTNLFRTWNIRKSRSKDWMNGTHLNKILAELTEGIHRLPGGPGMMGGGYVEPIKLPREASLDMLLTTSLGKGSLHDNVPLMVNTKVDVVIPTREEIHQQKMIDSLYLTITDLGIYGDSSDVDNLKDAGFMCNDYVFPLDKFMSITWELES